MVRSGIEKMSLMIFQVREDISDLRRWLVINTKQTKLNIIFLLSWVKWCNHQVRLIIYISNCPLLCTQ